MNREETNLLESRGDGESNRKNEIQIWLNSIDIEVESEWTTKDGTIDIFLPGRRTIIEVKKPNRLKDGPHVMGTGSRKGETAYEQLERYISAEREMDDSTNETTWLGCITDASKWWIYEWEQTRHTNGRILKGWEGTTLTKQNIKSLQHIFSRKSSKPWAPVDSSNLFEESLTKLQKRYEKDKDVPSTITHRGLWLQQLLASGNAPIDDIDDIFVRHTLLILITRIIMKDELITEGFVKWVSEEYEEVRSLKGIIEQYEWRRRSIDILRSLYIHFIPEKHRKLFGEYYTPDWLAEHICQKVIDERYIKLQLRNFREGKKIHGVLDPFCGSGTFLVHGITRILNSKALRESKLSKHQTNQFISEMIHGIDIHPVAVEMARANVKRLLPGINQINVYQGDSLLISRSDNSVFSNGGENMFLQSPGGESLIIPKSFLRNNDNIRSFVESAKEELKFPVGLESGLDQTEKEMIKDAHDSLIKIIKKEQNSIWYWYIINQASPILLKEKKVSRIVSNPPWVALQEIQTEERRKEMMNTSKNMNLYVGGNVSGKLDLAMLGIARSFGLYLKGDKAGYVLPQGAITGANNWTKLNQLYKGMIKEKWDLGRLAFHNTPSCVIITGKNETPLEITYRIKKNQKIDEHESWNDTSKKIKKVERDTFPKKSSNYKGRHGASLQPKCLVRIESQEKDGKKIKFSTQKTHKSPWNKFGSRTGTIPSKFVKKTISSSDILPFCAIYSHNIIPMQDGKWLPERNNVKYWKDVTSIYSRNKGVGKNTPKTLEDSLDYNGKLKNQMNAKKYRVAYNAVGDYLYSTIIEPEVICGVGIVSVETRSKTEALFLSALLNASCLHNAFIAARNTDRNFHMHILDKIPLPQFIKENTTHQKIVQLSKECEKIAKNNTSSDLGIMTLRSKIRESLSDTQQKLKIEIEKILPEYTR